MIESHRIITFSLFIWCMVIPWSSGLECYFCADTGDNNKCEDYNTYVNAFSEDASITLRNCTPGNDSICFIETYKNSLGSSVSQIRDCNDGKSFSFSNSEHKEKYNRLNQLGINNKTVCIYDGLNQVCLSKCGTDFCNGPQIQVSGVKRSCSVYVLIWLSIVLGVMV